MPDDATIRAREHFAAIDLACIAEMESGEVRVNDPAAYRAWCLERRDATLAGANDHTFTLRQIAHYFRTGECVALLP